MNNLFTYKNHWSTYGLTIKNDESGRAFVQNLRKNGYSVRCRGRGHRFGHGNMTKANRGNNKYQAHLPLDKATHIALYVSRRSS